MINIICDRSLLAGFILCIPLLLATLITFAYMNFANIGITINTLPVSAVGVGIGVNFGLYIFSRMREEMELNEGNWAKSLEVTALTASKGVVFTALPMVLPLLAWYYMSGLKFQAQMGLLLEGDGEFEGTVGHPVAALALFEQLGALGGQQVPHGLTRL